MEIPHSRVTLSTPTPREGKSFHMDAAVRSIRCCSDIYWILAQKTDKFL